MLSKQKLMELGLEEEMAEKVAKEAKAALDGNYVPKATFDAERDKVKNLNEQVSERDAQITQLGQFEGTANELSSKVAELEAQNAAAKAEHQAEMARLEKRTAITVQLLDTVHDMDDVLNNLDLEKLTVKDSGIEGLEEQITSLKTRKPHYFKEASAKDKSTAGVVFGKTPAENMDKNTETTNTDENFGKQLAKSRMTQSEVFKKASDIYFQ